MILNLISPHTSFTIFFCPTLTSVSHYSYPTRITRLSITLSPHTFHPSLSTHSFNSQPTLLPHSFNLLLSPFLLPYFLYPLFYPSLSSHFFTPLPRSIHLHYLPPPLLPHFLAPLSHPALSHYCPAPFLSTFMLHPFTVHFSYSLHTFPLSLNFCPTLLNSHKLSNSTFSLTHPL